MYQGLELKTKPFPNKNDINPRQLCLERNQPLQLVAALPIAVTSPLNRFKIGIEANLLPKRKILLRAIRNNLGCLKYECRNRADAHKTR